MEVQKSKSNKTVDSVDDISDYYIKRRFIDTSEPHYLTVESVGLTNNGDVAIKSQIQGEEIIITLGEYSTDINEKMDINYFFNNIFSPKSIYDEKQVLESEFKAYLSDDLKKLGLRKNEYMYNIEISDNVSIVEEIPDNFFKEIYITNSYISTKINNYGWIQDITRIESGDKKECFNLFTEPIDGYEIEWNLKIPFQSDFNSNPLVNLIENEGFGDPKNLEETGEVIVLHHSDISDDLNIIGLDTTKEWALITKNQFKKLDFKSDMSGMDKIHQLSGAFLMGCSSLALYLHLYNLIQQSIYEIYYIPIILLFTLSYVMMTFLLKLALDKPLKNMQDYF